MPSNFEGVVRDHEGIFPFGQVTDDTQLTLDLVQSLVQNRAWEPREYAKVMSQRYSEGRLIGAGTATRKALEGLSTGLSVDNWYDFSQESDGNGGAMRVAPLAFLYGDIGSLLCVSAEQCRLTHKGRNAIAGAQMMALAVHYLLPGTDPPRDAIIKAVDEIRDLYSGEEEDGNPMSPLRFATLVWVMIRLKDPQEAEAYLRRISPEGVTGWIVPTMMWALWSFVQHPFDYRKGIALAMSLGGDTDTVASITGSLIGVSSPSTMSLSMRPLVGQLRDGDVILEEQVRNLSLDLSTVWEGYNGH